MNINKLIGYLSIHYKFTIAFLALSLVPLIVLGIYSLSIFYNSLHTMSNNHVEDKVYSIARIMNSFLQTVRHDLSNLSRDNSSLIKILNIKNTSYYQQEGKEKLVNQLKPYFYAFLTQHEGYRKISYFDEFGWEKIQAELKNGDVKFASSESFQFLGESDFFQGSTVLSPGEIYISSLVLNKEPHILFGTPITNENGSKKGILVVKLSLSAYHNFTAKAHSPSKDLTILINNKGRYLYHPLKANGLLSDDYSPEVVSEILSGQKGVTRGSHEEIIGYAPVPDKFVEGHPWIVIHTIPEDAIFSPAKKLMMFFLGLVGVMIPVVLLAGFFAARHFTKPIEELRKGLASISRRDPNYELDIRTNDEIELLANDFNYMAQAISELEERLKIHSSDLEERVEERTREIDRKGQKLDNIVKGIGTALALVDGEMRILWHNDIFEEWFGKVDIARETKCYEMCRQLSCPCDECPGIKTFHGGGIQQTEHVIATRTGEKRVFQHTTGPIRDNGNIAQVLIMIQDITEQKQLEAQVMHQARMAAFGLLSAGVAHELGNPLTSLSSIVQYAQRKNYDESTQEEFSLMRTHIDRIANIVREMVDFARPPTYEWCPTQVNAVIQSAIGIAKYETCGLLQVCLNVILNAFDAIGTGGELSITSKQVEERIEITFKDNGSGMSKEVMEHVFDPFFTTKETGKGTGLGLSVSYGIIINFGGEIHVESQIGRGTAFTIVLPLGRSSHGRIHTNS